MTQGAPNGSRPTSAVWLVGYDGSENSRHAALWAASHVDGRADELRFVTAWHAPVSAAYPTPSRLPPDLANDIEAGAWRHVNALADSFRSTVDVPITTAVGCGDASDLLLDAAPRQGAIVVGSRGRGGFARLVLGSTSTQIATHAEIPTVVVPFETRVDALDRIVVAIDGSTNSLAALDWAIDSAAVGARLDCVMVWDVSPIAFGSDQVAIPEASGAAESRLEHLVATRSSRRSDVALTQHFIEGSARHELRRLADDADLLVMGARGHGAVGAALLGSVSTWLLHHARVPMVVVPATAG
ncbi:MAG: universal stress protein [Actinomycetota bacterium]